MVECWFSRADLHNDNTPGLNYLKALDTLINGLNMASECDLPIQELSVHKSYPTENPQQLLDVVLNKLMLSGNKHNTRF